MYLCSMTSGVDWSILMGFLSTKGREAAKMKAISKMSIRENESLGTYNSNQLRDIVAGWYDGRKCS